jgi:hypothetical protein
MLGRDERAGLFVWNVGDGDGTLYSVGHVVGNSVDKCRHHRRHDAQHNDTQHNDTQHTNIKTRHSVLKTLSLLLQVIRLGVDF